MQIRPVTLEDLDLFLEVGGSPDHRKEVRQYLDRMFAAGSMRPEWCFVAVRGRFANAPTFTALGDLLHFPFGGGRGVGEASGAEDLLELGVQVGGV